MNAPPNSNSFTLIDELLEEQQRLTAVSRFARRYEQGTLPAQAKYYRDLIPLTQPRRGEQYAFEVDLDRCSGCKACVSACHSLNGLDDGEAWRDTGLLFSDDWRAPFQQTVTTACHHCAEPGCADGCPVLAYEKDPVTGIVRHLDDQCIGCQYCTMKCPYDVPKYSSRRGIVRKCDMCAERLAVGEAPACVQACPHEAIRITVRSRDDILAASGRGALLPSAPASCHTKPSTNYISSRALPHTLLSGDHAVVRPEPAHLPLVLMLVLTQSGVGASVMTCFSGGEPARWLALIAVLACASGLGVATLHLGKPLKAWRAFLGWRTSWFSREVIAFGAFMPMATIAALAAWRPELPGIMSGLKWAAALSGLGAVGCSAMIYVNTHREYWSVGNVFGRFIGTTAVLGLAVALAVPSLAGGEANSAFPGVVLPLVLAAASKLAFERRIFSHLVDPQIAGLTPLNKTALLLEGELGIFARGRILCGIFGGVLLPLFFLLNPSSMIPVAAVLFCVAGELLERFLFFTAVAPRRMPGGVHP